MSKYSLKFKLEVVNRYLSGQGGQKAVARHFGIQNTYVRKWVRIFKQHGAQGLQPKIQNNSYTPEFKYQVVQAVHQKKLSLLQAAVDFGVMEPATVHGWLRLYEKGGIKALQTSQRGRQPKMNKPLTSNKKPDAQRTQQELLEELTYLRAEVDYLKKYDALIRARQIRAKKPESSQD